MFLENRPSDDIFTNVNHLEHTVLDNDPRVIRLVVPCFPSETV